MTQIRVGDTLTLPELAKQQGLEEATFTVDEVIKGGMGVCLRIRPTMLGAPFALKLPVFTGAYDAEVLDRFLTELRVWLNLSACDGIVEALCVFRWRGRPVVVSRWMEGGSLRTRMAKKDAAAFYSTMIRVAGALEWAATKQDVLHRDLKPENILFDEHGKAQVSDWGIAEILEEGTDGWKHAPPGPPVKTGSAEARPSSGRSPTPRRSRCSAACRSTSGATCTASARSCTSGKPAGRPSRRRPGTSSGRRSCSRRRGGCRGSSGAPRSARTT